ASGLLPQLRGLDRRHKELDRSGAIHFLPHEGFDLANHPKPERHPRVDTACESPDQARTDHQLVAEELRVGWSLLERCKKISGSAHSGGTSQDATFYLNSHPSQPRRGPAFKSPAICERMGMDRLLLDCVCSIETAIGLTSASSFATGATRFSGASASRNIPGNSRRAGSKSGKRRCRRCTANCRKRWACCPPM